MSNKELLELFIDTRMCVCVWFVGVCTIFKRECVAFCDVCYLYYVHNAQEFKAAITF